MATTRQEIREWLEEAKIENATHMIVARDTFDGGEFPVSVKPGEDVQEKIKEYSNPNQMLTIVEIYKMDRDLDEQIAAPRARGTSDACHVRSATRDGNAAAIARTNTIDACAPSAMKRAAVSCGRC